MGLRQLTEKVTSETTEVRDYYKQYAGRGPMVRIEVERVAVGAVRWWAYDHGKAFAAGQTNDAGLLDMARRGHWLGIGRVI